VVAAPDAERGLRKLVERCVVEASGELSPAVVETLSRAMLEADPQAEITLALECPACGQRWQALFEIAAFLWNELAAQARRLLHEIDALARAYGWNEREILSLSAVRRQSYLELIEA
jgi:hypothetical protein